MPPAAAARPSPRPAPPPAATAPFPTPSRPHTGPPRLDGGAHVRGPAAAAGPRAGGCWRGGPTALSADSNQVPLSSCSRNCPACCPNPHLRTAARAARDAVKMYITAVLDQLACATKSCEGRRRGRGWGCGPGGPSQQSRGDTPSCCPAPRSRPTPGRPPPPVHVARGCFKFVWERGWPGGWVGNQSCFEMGPKTGLN
jgi:hypothetical protein